MTAAIVTVLIGVAGVLGLLLRISFQLGALVQRFGDHVVNADKIHTDQESRIRYLEQRRPRPSGGHV